VDGYTGSANHQVLPISAKGVPVTPYYERGGIVIYHGDSRDILPSLRADAVITDPPFGVRKDAWDSFDSESHLMSFTGEWLIASLRAARVVALFWPDKYLPALMIESWKRSIPYRRSLIWRKPSGSQMAGAAMDGFWFDFEAVYVFGAKPAASTRTRFSVIDARTITGQGHGCEKHLAPYANIIEGYAPTSLIDPFMGTGTSLIAAKQLGRTATGIDASEANCEIAAKRLEQDILPLEASA
jgi:hypothetical protein